jgi:hypothetical protein
MNILPSEQELFNNTMATLAQSFKERSHNDIGIGSFGIATLIAQYDIKESGSSSGLWLKNLEKAVEIAQGLFVKNNIDSFIRFSEQLIDRDATSSMSAVKLNGSDRKGYSVKDGDTFTTYIQNQSTQFIYKLSPLISYSSIEKLGYSARKITEKSFASGNVKKYFKYGDSRDEGYAGTVKMPFMGMHYGYGYTATIKYAFESIWGAEIED